MRVRNQGGFTLIEVIVVAGIIAVLAGILVPLIFKEIDESKISRAAADVKSISSALIVMRKDTGQWPVSAGCTPEVTLLTGSGVQPAFAAGWDDSTAADFGNYVNTDDNGCWPATWKGPYMPVVNPDPWGRTYVTNAAAFLAANGPVWIISAGPDGVLDTEATSSVVANDDVGVRLR